MKELNANQSYLDRMNYLHKLGRPLTEIETLGFWLSVAISFVVVGLGSRKMDEKWRAKVKIKFCT